MNKRNYVLGGIMGACIGDALGVPFENSSRFSLRKNPIRGMEGYGYWNQPPGTWSDDSSLMLCLADSLCNGYNLKDISDKFIKWIDEGYWTPFGEVFDIGNTTLQAINRIKMGVNPVEAGGKSESDNGNGSLMRILPMAFFLENCNDTNYRFRVIHEVSSVTHAHSRSLLACSMYIEMAINLLRGHEPQKAYSIMKEIIIDYYSKLSGFKEELKTFSRFLDDNISECKENEIASSGYVVDTLESAVWCFLSSDSYSNTVLKAINLGGDTDTTATVAGGLAGLYYKIDNIPNVWIEKIARKNDIIDLSYRLANSIYKL